MNFLIFNFLTSSLNLFIFNCLTPNFCFPKNISFTSRREQLFINFRSQFRILNSPGKMMTCYPRGIVFFEVLQPMAEYNKMKILRKRYQTNSVRPFRDSWCISALRHLGLNRFCRYRTKICEIQISLLNKKFQHA